MAAGSNSISTIDAQHRPAGVVEEAAAAGSATDKHTRETKMTLDEAHLILNVKPGANAESLTAVSLSSTLLSCMN